METLGLKPSQEELDQMIHEIDQDGNGEIEFDGMDMLNACVGYVLTVGKLSARWS